MEHKPFTLVYRREEISCRCSQIWSLTVHWMFLLLPNPSGNAYGNCLQAQQSPHLCLKFHRRSIGNDGRLPTQKLCEKSVFIICYHILQGLDMVWEKQMIMVSREIKYGHFWTNLSYDPFWGSEPLMKRFRLVFVSSIVCIEYGMVHEVRIVR